MTASARTLVDAVLELVRGESGQPVALAAGGCEEALAGALAERGHPLVTVRTPLVEGPAALCVNAVEEATRHGQAILPADEIAARKVLSAAAARVAWIVSREGLVDVLGARAPVPVEVIPFARSFVARRLVGLGGRPSLRAPAARAPLGNTVLEVEGLDLLAPAACERTINDIPGVVAVGLCAQRPADWVLVKEGDRLAEVIALSSRVPGQTG